MKNHQKHENFDFLQYKQTSTHIHVSWVSVYPSLILIMFLGERKFFLYNIQIYY